MKEMSSVEEVLLSVTSEGQELQYENSLNISKWLLGEDIVGPVLATFVGIEFILSLPLNLFILIHTVVYGRRSSMKSSTILLGSLALSNLMTSVFYMPLVVVAAGAGEWLFGSTDFTRNALCQFHGFVFAYSIGVSSHIITIISIDRFLSIVKPVFHQKYFTWKTSLLIMIFVWVIDIILNLSPYYGSGLGEFRFAGSVGGCVPIWVGHLNYVIILGILSLIPVTTIIVTTLWSFFFTRGFLRRNLRRHRRTLNKQNFEVQKHIYSVRVMNLIGIFGTLLFFNAISWLPYIAVTISGVIIGLDNLPRQVYASIFVLFLFTNVTNPIIQVYFRKDIWMFLKDLPQKLAGLCKAKPNSSLSRDSMLSSQKHTSHTNCDVPDAALNATDKSDKIGVACNTDCSTRDSEFTSNSSAEVVQPNSDASLTMGNGAICIVQMEQLSDEANT